MTRQEILDLYFLEARARLIDLAAFLDRLDRGTGETDFRGTALQQAMQHLHDAEPRRAEAVLRALSDPTLEPIERAAGKGAVGAWPGIA